MFCGDRSVWVRQLDPDKATFRMYGKGHTFAHDMTLCDDCEQRWQADDIATLIERFRHSDEHFGDEAELMVSVVRRAGEGLSATPYDDHFPAGVKELRAQGFVPLQELTGLDEVWRVWPELHRRSVPETRPEWSPATECWLVRSPSTDLEPEHYLGAIWRLAEAGYPAEISNDEYWSRVERAAARVFTMDPAEVRRQST
ncbi:hypothetical protein VV02_06425 [Luteipulveratus mongoliensis]|uniref:Uncharacterized protein n=2 Tax=Luteipulveratus mongoliensis TaxID=571913 RepID=A0A0K1JFU9_9MICO|nr:hypothetical protein VV02_06425 [Luteipulveratus mongoliensis]